MSLTRELRSPRSWVNQFFKARIPRVVEFARGRGGAVKAMETVVPSSSAESARLVGTAFDYRLRMHVGADFADSEVLPRGIDLLRRMGSGLGPTADQKWAAAIADLLTEVPAGDEMVKARTSVVLAWVDWGYRSGGIWSDGLRAAVEAIGRNEELGWDSVGASVDPCVAAEVAALMDIVEVPRADSALCGTSFLGSRFVGGADADLILDGCLYDVKTTARPRRGLTPMLRQLLGYALLDWADEFELNRVGFYWSRQGKWMSWELDQLIGQSASPAGSLGGLRKEFKRCAHERAPAFLQRSAGRRRQPNQPSTSGASRTGRSVGRPLPRGRC